ncbi:unnamed protein product [Protopolystoma xenopodis]|uniref:Uncharacterized protein n=1 Tax=Protopolystoma xenopodis TaxID=117903 RepID=A0A3S5BB12_9PLAT|nr:unnamed protein product [Protopolystoma xenopodis]
MFGYVGDSEAIQVKETLGKPLRRITICRFWGLMIDRFSQRLGIRRVVAVMITSIAFGPTIKVTGAVYVVAYDFILNEF